jgi:type II secretory pathway pseudopilin PulG
MARRFGAARGERGSTLIEALVATLLLSSAALVMSHLLVTATAENVAARGSTIATILAEQKLEHLRSLAWGFDSVGVPVADTSTDTTAQTEPVGGGTGLQAAPPRSIRENTPGYVDHLNAAGSIVGRGTVPPPEAVYTRRWSIAPLAGKPETLLIQVLVTTRRDEDAADESDTVPGESRLVTMKTRRRP